MRIEKLKISTIIFIVCISLVHCDIKLTEDELIISRIVNVINSLNSSQCKSDINATVNAYRDRKAWAIAMFDSSVKSPVGIEYGVDYQLGNFDECMSIKTERAVDGVSIKPKYCLLEVNIDGYSIRQAATRHRELKNSTLIHWAVCMPSSCSNEDVKEILSSFTGRDDVNVDARMCQINESPQYSSIDLVFGLTLLSFLSIVIFSSLYHIYVINTTKSGKLRHEVPLEEIIKSFSVISNLKKLVKESKDEFGLGCINGIKAVSMLCIITGHALVFMLGGPMQNTSFYAQQSQMLQNAFIINSPLFVDSFLLLSGFLFARLVLIEMDKRRGKINFGLLYVFRYLRLTPAYLMMIGLYSTWFIRIGEGPLWKQRISLEQERCQASWWKNILYINNYYGNEALCMFQSWYLAADTQLFILAPLFIYPLWKCKKLGLYLIAFAAVASVVVPFYITFTQNLDPTFMIWQNEISDLSTNDYFINTYGKTHMRATSYVFGILIGFIAYYIHKKKAKISQKFRNFMWIFSTIVGIFSMYFVTFYYIPTYKYSQLESATYNSLHRLGWSIFTGWMVLGCVTSDGNGLKSFLSSQALVPISRLTYCAYLTNGFIELYLAANVRTPKFMSVTNLTGETLSHVALTFIAALVLCLMFESPIHGLEKMLLRRNASAMRDSKRSESDDLNVVSTSSSHSPSTSEAST